MLSRRSVLAMAGASLGDVAAVLDGLMDVGVPVVLDFRWRPQSRDPNDDLVLETAINGNAAVVATYNVADIQAGARRFGIAAERPGAVEGMIER